MKAMLMIDAEAYSDYSLISVPAGSTGVLAKSPSRGYVFQPEGEQFWLTVLSLDDVELQ